MVLYTTVEVPSSLEVFCKDGESWTNLKQRMRPSSVKIKGGGLHAASQGAKFLTATPVNRGLWLKRKPLEKHLWRFLFTQVMVVLKVLFRKASGLCGFLKSFSFASKKHLLFWRSIFCCEGGERKAAWQIPVDTLLHPDHGGSEGTFPKGNWISFGFPWKHFASLPRSIWRCLFKTEDAPWLRSETSSGK